MQRLLILILLICLSACKEKPSGPQENEDIHLYIENVKILDGTGAPAYTANVAIAGDHIQKISKSPLKIPASARVIDGKGRYLAPGFIDLHSHGNPARTPQFENFLAMGVTTITLGQDGSGPQVADLGEWMETIDGTGPNIAMFTGHGTLREMTGATNATALTSKQLDSLLTLLDVHLDDAFGLSTGLEYTPGMYADEPELLAIADRVGKKGRMIMSHMRNEDDEQLFGSIQELAAQGIHCQVHISHLKSVYGQGVERAEEILEFINSLRNEGVKITADIYPYSASYTGIGIVFPEWAKTNTQMDSVLPSRRNELEQFLREKVKRRNGPEATLFGTKPFAGKTLLDLQEEMKVPFEQILIDSIGPQGASAAYFVMNEDLQTRLMMDSLVAISSDGSPTGYHPRGHGTFARFINQFVVENKRMSLESAVYKMTGLPAEILGIQDRGLLKAGMKADLILFDPVNVRENASFEDPFQLAEGFDLVLVNGKIVRENGSITSDLPGKFLTPSP